MKKSNCCNAPVITNFWEDGSPEYFCTFCSLHLDKNMWPITINRQDKNYYKNQMLMPNHPEKDDLGYVHYLEKW